ncbi:hypothetical protein LX36DRAFT_384513 [Colletotrichum falcatum]|nr:hypothetical protein LX36DRAFT_384513 [Colletotrichum falcatum]
MSRSRSRSRSWSQNRSRSRSRDWSQNRTWHHDRSRRHGNLHPVSIHPDDEGDQLVETLSYKQKDYDDMESTRDHLETAGGMFEAWYKKHASFGDGIDTELLVINAAESFADKKGVSVVTLFCQKDALGKSNAAPHQMYWLHLRHTSDIIKVLKRVVISCPFIDERHKSLALGLLGRVSDQEGDIASSETNITRGAKTMTARVDRVPVDDLMTQDSVTFNATPYLVFREGQARQSGNDTMQSLVSSQYGYNVGDSRDKMQVLSETQKWLGKEILHVAKLRSLLIGSGE